MLERDEGTAQSDGFTVRHGAVGKLPRIVDNGTNDRHHAGAMLATPTLYEHAGILQEPGAFHVRFRSSRSGVAEIVPTLASPRARVSTEGASALTR